MVKKVDRKKFVRYKEGAEIDVQHGFDKISGACKAGKRYL